MFVAKAAVVGAGSLASEIAEVIATAGLPVVRADADTGLGALGDVDLVVEATPDDLEAKLALFAALDAATPGHAILATTSARLSVCELGAATDRPELVVGMHFHRPAAVNRLVEVVEGDDTAPETVQDAVRFAGAIRKTAIRCLESPGLVVGRIVTASDAGPDPRVEPESERRAWLRGFVEACLVVEEGVAGVRDVDTGMAAGAGAKPGPFAAADRDGLDVVLAELEAAGGEAFEPPVLLRRLVVQGRTGPAAGQGFHPYPRPDAGWEDAAVKLETRGAVAVAWLDSPPANAVSAPVVDGLERAWDAVEAAGVRALVVASANPALFCAGADIRAFATMDRGACSDLLDRMHRLLRAWEQSRVVTIAAVNGLALGGGCELAMGCDVRIAAAAATFGQPEVDLGIIPGFGGTQRLPRLVGEGKALEMSLTGQAIDAQDALAHGLATRVVADHELLDTALGWARKLAGQAPVAVEHIKQVCAAGDLDDGLAAEQQAFLAAFASADATEGIGAFLAKRAPTWTGR